MAFRFSLAAVLRLREINEQREERLLSQILAQVTQTREAIATLERQISEAAALRERGLRGRMSSSELQIAYGVQALLKERRQFSLEQLAQFEQLRDRQIQSYQAAHRAREVLSNMRLEQHEIYAAEQARQQQNELDDMFIARMPRAGRK